MYVLSLVLPAVMKRLDRPFCAQDIVNDLHARGCYVFDRKQVLRCLNRQAESHLGTGIKRHAPDRFTAEMTPLSRDLLESLAESEDSLREELAIAFAFARASYDRKSWV